MALVKCPECGKEVSNTAIQCPNCGYSVKEHFEREKQIKKIEEEAKAEAYAYVKRIKREAEEAAKREIEERKRQEEVERLQQIEQEEQERRRIEAIAEKQRRAEKSKKYLIIGGVFGLILVMALVLVYVAFLKTNIIKKQINEGIQYVYSHDLDSAKIIFGKIDKDIVSSKIAEEINICFENEEYIVAKELYETASDLDAIVDGESEIMVKLAIMLLGKDDIRNAKQLFSAVGYDKKVLEDNSEEIYDLAINRFNEKSYDIAKECFEITKRWEYKDSDDYLEAIKLIKEISDIMTIEELERVLNFERQDLFGEINYKIEKASKELKDLIGSFRSGGTYYYIEKNIACWGNEDGCMKLVLSYNTSKNTWCTFYIVSENNYSERDELFDIDGNGFSTSYYQYRRISNTELPSIFNGYIR